MFGNFTQSALDISKCLWEVIGGCLIPALLYFAWRSWKYRRCAWLYIVVVMVIFAWMWRLYVGTISTRYYLVMALPSMLLIFYAVWDGLKRWKKLAYCMLLILFALCVGRDLRSNPQGNSELAVYEHIKKDAAQYKQPLGIVYGESAAQIEFYSGIKTIGYTYYCDNLRLLCEGIKNNFNMHYGLCDVLYIYMPLTSEYRDVENSLTKLMPEGVEIFDRVFMDRRKKKELIVLKYIPQKEIADSSNVPYLTNGDFTKLLSGEALNKKHEYFGRRALRFISERPLLPQDWDFYVSLLTRCNSLANVEKRGNKNVLRLQAQGSYIVLISKFFAAKDPCTIYLTLKANSDSSLLLLRHYYHPATTSSVMITTMPLNLPAGIEKEIKWDIPAGHNKKLRRIWIQLNYGDIEISEVKIQQGSF